MTRETKIGLLVGLAFIIVIGILLSDHFTSTMDPPQARPAGRDSVQRALVVPQTGRNRIIPPGELDLPQDVEPGAPIQVEPGRGQGGRAHVDIMPGPRDRLLPPLQGQDRAQSGLSFPPPLVAEDDPRGGIHIGPELSGHTTTPGPGIMSLPLETELVIRPQPPEPIATVPVGGRQYTAVDGDTLTKIATRFLGSGSKANVDAILKLNPSLRGNPLRLRAGETYVLPAATEAANAVVPLVNNDAQQPRTPTPTPAPPTAAPGREAVYVTREGDNLWRIALEQCGSGNLVDEILELNKDQLKGSNRIRPNMKLKLPPRQVASASN